jgi:CheY-like chemotaxis protein
MTEQPAEIVRSKVSVYEIELDLSDWKAGLSSEAPGFVDAIAKLLPSLKEHDGLDGKPGGFGQELQDGTSFAHVIEHVILELIHLADAEKEYYTGWTRQLDKRAVFIVHYGAPDFLTGRLAAILSIDLVKRAMKGETLSIDHYLQILKQPHAYFTEGEAAAAGIRADEPVSVIQEIKEGAVEMAARPAAKRRLSGEQMDNIKTTLWDIHNSLDAVSGAWRDAFLAYGGRYSAAILDKMELININNFFGAIIARNFQAVLAGIRKAVQMIASYRIPRDFIVHSLWLYKNKLLSCVMEKHKYHDEAMIDRFIKDFEDFYQIILQNVTKELAEQGGPEANVPSGEFRKFTELKSSKGVVLVIDDDEMIRSVVHDILELNGYGTILAQSSAEAFDLLSKSGEAVALAILDIVRPDDSSFEEIYTRIRFLYPDVKILVTSGFSVSRELDKFLKRDSVNFLKKPFTDHYLLCKVKSMLG